MIDSLLWSASANTSHDDQRKILRKQAWAYKQRFGPEIILRLKEELGLVLDTEDILDES